MSPTRQSDERLMQGVGDNDDRSSLEVLVRRYAGPLLTFLHRMTGNLHQAEDLFQDVFLNVWRKRGQYIYPKPFRPWLYKVAVNRCHEVHRRRPQPANWSSAPQANESVAVASNPGPDETAIATETAVMVETALAGLAPKQRAVVALRIWQGLTYTEIARAVGTNESTVRSNMHHGLAAMRLFLEPRLRD